MRVIEDCHQMMPRDARFVSFYRYIFSSSVCQFVFVIEQIESYRQCKAVVCDTASVGVWSIFGNGSTRYHLRRP